MSIELQSERLQRLCQEIAGIGHPEYPFLDADRGPNSRIPCQDFTSFIADCLIDADLHTIRELLGHLGRTRKGTQELQHLGQPEILKVLHPSWRFPFRRFPFRYWPTVLTDEYAADLQYLEPVLRVVGLPFQKYVQFRNPRARFELKAMYLLGAGQETIARALSCYEVNWLPPMKQHVYAEIQATANPAHWEELKDYKLYEEHTYMVPSLPRTGASRRLQEMSVGARLHLLEAIQKGGGILPSLTNHNARSYGLYIPDSTDEILASGLLKFSRSFDKFLDSFLKDEIIQALIAEKIPHKKAWRKRKLAETLHVAAPDLVHRMMKGKLVVEIAPEHAGDLTKILDYSRQLLLPFLLLARLRDPSSGHPLPPPVRE